MCDVLLNLVTFASFTKREKHPLRSTTFNNVAGLKATLFNGFSRFLNCTNRTKSRNASHILDAKKQSHKYLNRINNFSYRCGNLFVLVPCSKSFISPRELKTCYQY